VGCDQKASADAGAAVTESCRISLPDLKYVTN
jgi:hypothetical protein